MIKIAGKEISLVKIGRRSVNVIIYMGLKVWEALRSCFSNGWNDNKPWMDEEGWVD